MNIGGKKIVNFSIAMYIKKVKIKNTFAKIEEIFNDSSVIEIIDEYLFNPLIKQIDYFLIKQIPINKECESIQFDHEISDIKDIDKSDKNQLIKLDYYKSYIDGTITNPIIIEMIEKNIGDLKLGKSQLPKYETIICDGNLEHHYNLCALIMKTEDLRTRVINTENKIEKNLRLGYHKAILLHDIEKLLEIQTLDIDSIKYVSMYDKKIEIPNNIYKSYIKLFKGSRKLPQTWRELYFLLIAGYKSLTGKMNLIISKSKSVKIKKETKSITNHDLDKNLLKLNLELLNIRSVYISEYQNCVYELVNLKKDQHKI